MNASTHEVVLIKTSNHEKSQMKLQGDERCDQHTYREVQEPKKLSCLNLVIGSTIEMLTVHLKPSEYARANVFERANQHAFSMRLTANLPTFF